MEALIEKTKLMLNSISEEHKESEAKLKADDRLDEALIEKIKANIADIFLTVFGVSCKQIKQKGGEKDELTEKFMCFFETIPATWKASLEDAKEQDDFETIYKEEAKLQTAQRIKENFEKLLEESDV